MIRPLLQTKPQLPPLQVGVPPTGNVQALLQLPQFCTSEPRATHWPLHSVVPDGQLAVHTPLEHTLPVAHALPHDPQLMGSVCLLTHAPEQTDWPDGQLCTHAPVAQLTLPPAGDWQAIPQLPQLSTSLEVFTHWVPHFANPALH